MLQDCLATSSVNVNVGCFFFNEEKHFSFLTLFSSITFEAAEKRRSLSTLVQGADKYLL